MEVWGRLSCSDCQWSPSSNEAQTAFSVPANKKTFADGIFAYRVDRAKVRQACGDQFPVLTSVMRAVDIRMKIVDAEAAHRGVSRTGHRSETPRSESPCSTQSALGRDVGPILPAVMRDPKQAVIGARPQGIQRLERWSERVDDPALFLHAFVGQRADAWRECPDSRASGPC